MNLEQTVRVTAVRSQNPRGFGGAIFTGQPIDVNGSVQDAKGYCVIKVAGPALAGALVERGQWWKVSGEASERVLEVNGYLMTETQVDASCVVLLRPSGEHIVRFMADSPAFEGIGRVKARKLWETFGEELYAILDGGDVAKLATVLPEERAVQVTAAWAQQGDSRTLQWLQSQGFDVALGQKVLKFFGAETADKLEEDPYRLLSFCAGWRQTDRLAREHFGMAVDDPRRLRGAVEEACYRVFAAGHTSVLSSRLMDYLQGVLGSQTQTFRWRSLVPTALSTGLENGSFVVGHHGVQPLGAMVMEREVAQTVVDRLDGESSGLLPRDDVDELLRAYERAEDIELNPQQWEAVHLGNSKRFALITGGAGVGKTTVLKALYEVYDQANVSVIQLALAGRAAKRMQEATGRSASTIANFLRSTEPDSLDERHVVVVDEASMVDIISMARLCQTLGPGPRLLLVGDPSQLMPVGPGLVLHALTQVAQVPVAELTVVKRYGGAIAATAAAIRHGRWPTLPNSVDEDIAFLPCDESLTEVVLDLYRKAPGRTQVLCARRNGPDGTKAINAACQQALTAGSPAVMVWDGRHEAMVRTGFHLGDPVLCTRNMWDRGLQNGSLGVIVQVETVPITQTDASGEQIEATLAWVEWDDGVRRPIVEDMLDDLELGYAITVHKSQGSQWPRVIVPLTAHRLLDRTLVYTAVTRARSQVLMVGTEAAAKAAVEGTPRAQRRQVALDLHVQQLLAKTLS